MSADDQAFLDILSSVPNDIKRYSNDVADYVDRHLEHVSNTLREALSSTKWIPESARPKPPPPPPRNFVGTISTNSSIYNQIYGWVIRNKILTTVIVVAVGGATYHIIRKRAGRKKRRGKRAGNGARLEVVVLAAPPSEAITRSISLDLERRGFIVYIVCNTIEEELLVQNESRPDIKPLMIDIVDTSSARSSIDRFTAYLQTPHFAFEGAKPHHLVFRSLIIIPSPSYPSSPIATLPPSTLSDLLNTRLLTPILTLQSFLPLLQSLPLHHPRFHNGPPPIGSKPSVLILTPSIISSLNPAFHLSESSIVSALVSFANVLTAELQPLNIPVTHLQLGTFDFSAFSPHNRQLTVQSQRAETLKWDDGARQAYGKNYVALSKGKGAGNVIGKGSPLRDLNNAVFDAMVRDNGGVINIGMGSSLYGFVGRWVPRGLVAWMIGIRKVGNYEKEFGKGTSSGSDSGSTASSPRSLGLQGNVYGLGMGESEYVSIYGTNKEEGGDLEE